MATRKKSARSTGTTGTRTRTATAARKATTARKTTTARKGAATAGTTARKGAAGSARKVAKTTTGGARKTTATKSAASKKVAAKKVAAKKVASKKVAAKKVVAKKSASKQAAPKQTASVRKAASKKPATAGRASASGRTRDTASAGTPSRRRAKVTPEQALANTRRLLEAKEAKRHETPPWQALGEGGAHGGVPHAGFQSDEARVHAYALHNDEVDLPAVQGHVSALDRRTQGRRDHRGQGRR